MEGGSYRAVHQVGYGWVIVGRDGNVLERIGANRKFAEDKAAAYNAGELRNHQASQDGGQAQ